MTTIASHTTRASGTVLTAAIYNTDHNIHVSNAQALNATKLEGATPPVVDGQGVVWNGTSGAALRSAGFTPIPATRLVTAGSGLTGGGDLSADRTLAVDFATQAEAEAAATTVDAMSPLRTKQQIDFRLSNLATAQARTDNTKLMTPLRVDDEITSRLATQAEAEGGTENTHLMTALRVAQALAIGGSLTISAVQALAGTWATGYNAAAGAVFIFSWNLGTGNIQVSCDAGANYTLVFSNTSSHAAFGLIAVKGNLAASGKFSYFSGNAAAGVNGFALTGTPSTINILGAGTGSGAIIRVA